MNVWYLTDDLMFSSRVLAFAERAGHAVMMLASPALLAERIRQATSEDLPEVVLLDLTLPGLQIQSTIEQLRAAAPQARIIAYGPHVHATKLEAAQAAGCDQVMSNGQFDRSFTSLLTNAG